MTPLELAISRIKILNLSKYPGEELAKHLKNFSGVAAIDYWLHPGKKILRARPHNKDGPFVDKPSLSFKPQQFNTTYQRASTPNRTMFYGSIIPEDLDDGDLDNERYIVSMEAMKWLRDNTTCGFKKITYSKWEVVEDIRLFALLHKKAYYEATSHTKKIMDDYYAFLKKHPDKEYTSLLANEFLADEFGKEESEPDYHYLISSHFTEFITTKGVDGVLYPSVRVGGRGYNIALTPDATNTKVKLVAAGECSIYKRYEKSVIDNDTQVIIIDDNIPFEYSPVSPKHHAGELNCLKELGVNYISELCKPF